MPQLWMLIEMLQLSDCRTSCALPFEREVEGDLCSQGSNRRPECRDVREAEGELGQPEEPWNLRGSRAPCPLGSLELPVGLRAGCAYA
jgi:hypothetical protein